MSHETFVEMRQDGNVTSLWFDNVHTDFEHWLLFCSDVHHDSVKCNRGLEEQHLQEAKKRNADIFFTGDLFDAMQGRFDPRRNMDELRPEYRRSDYYDYVVEDLAEFYSPYAENIKLFGKGNHETSVLKNANVDLLNRLAFLINIQNKTDVKVGGYGGWIRLMFNLSNSVGPKTSKKIKYFHGFGSTAPVTRGVIQTNRQAVYQPDADVIVNGHNHHAYYVPITRERLSGKGKIYFDIQHHIRVPGYKMDYADGSGGWFVERGGVPKPIGSWWIHLTFNYVNGAPYINIKPEPEIEGPVSFSYDDPVDVDHEGMYPEV